MSSLIFQSSYIVIIPSYYKTDIHKHPFLLIDPTSIIAEQIREQYIKVIPTAMFRVILQRYQKIFTICRRMKLYASLKICFLPWVFQQEKQRKR